MKKNCLFVFLLFLMLNPVFLAAQGVGVNNSGQPAHPSSGLDVNFSDKGMLVPRLTDAQRNTITNPAEGLLIFNITTNCFNFFRTGIWFELCGNCIAPPLPVAANSGPICAGDTLFLPPVRFPER